ncbi:MAG: hypothetical protein Q9164_002175 [Protoblastenia rupestris]
MALTLHNGALRGMAARELAMHLRSRSAAESVEAVTDHLLGAIEQQSLPPNIISIWLTASGSWEPMFAAVQQPFSNYVRRKGISHLGRALRSNDWQHIWKRLGGVQGIDSMLSKLSVGDNRLLCQKIGRCARLPELPDEERRRRVTELLQNLLKSVNDQRPLHKHYAQLVPACTPDFVHELLQSKSHPLLEYLSEELIARNHYPLLRRLVLGNIDGNTIIVPNDTDLKRRMSNFLPPLLETVPQQPGEESGLSATMCFAKVVLHRLATSDDAYKSLEPFDAYFERRVVRSLIRRTVKSAAGVEQILDVVHLATSFLKHHDLRIEPDKGSLTFHVARYWSKSPGKFEDHLKALLSLQKYDHTYFDRLCVVLRSIRGPCRYRFLSLSVLHTKDLGFDINEEKGLQAFTTQMKYWPMGLFLLLQKGHSVLLLERLMRIQPERSFLRLATGISILSHPAPPSTRWGNPRLLSTLLKQKASSSAQSNEAQETVQAQQRKAMTSREQSDRAFFAKSAAFYAIASGSLELYEEVIKWMRRFLRDYMTATAIYDQQAVLTMEGIALLSGIPQDMENVSLDEVRFRVTQGNKIIYQQFESAILSLKEPSFFADDWWAPLKLFEEVISARDSRATLLQRKHNLQDDQLCAILYIEMMRTMLKAEEIAIQPEHKALGFDNPDSGSFFRMGEWKATSRSTHLFFDCLAKERDNLWKRVRRQRNPATVVLPEPWPRGLPLQNLPCLHSGRHDITYGPMPYICSRATAIVFIPAELALAPSPHNQEIADAIGNFADDYRIALKVYVMHGDGREAQEARALRAFAHALGTLSLGRMSEEEAHRFWKPIFANALPKYKLPWKEPKVKYPILPTDIDSIQPCEWSPNDGKPPDIKLRKLSSAVLDCMLHPASGSYRHTGKVEPPTSSIPPVTYPPIFSQAMYYTVQGKSFAEKEGIIAASLLWQSLKAGQIAKPVANLFPFPSKDDARYPALFFDEEFVTESEKSHTYDEQILERIITIVPPKLIKVLAKDALTKLHASSPAPKQRSTYRLIRLLAASDRPQLATKLIADSIIQHPDASSWHRQLLTAGFLHHLPAHEATRMILDFADMVLEKLESQTSSHTRPEAGSASTESDSAPVIKVTTIKFLSQLIDNVKVISHHTSIAILRKLFETSNHIDVRVAVVESLLAKLARCGMDDAIAEAVFVALHAVIPVAGSLNERSPAGELEWAETEAKNIVPEVRSDSTPLFRSVQSSLGHYQSLSQSTRQKVLIRVMLPILEESKVNSARWVKSFLAKYPVELKVADVPIFPVHPESLGFLLKSNCDILSSAPMNLYHQWLLTNMSPPLEVTRIIDKIRNDPDLRESNEGKHWLNIYGKGHSVHSDMPDLLKNPWKPSTISDGININHVQNHVFEQARLLLYIPYPIFTHWKTFMQRLAPVTSSYASNDTTQSWLSYLKPVVQRILDDIEALRTLEWQRNPKRRPAVLPDTFPYRLWLLDYTTYHSTTPQLERCENFAAQLIDKLDEVYTLGIAHHNKLSEIKAAALKSANQDYTTIAWHISRRADVEVLDRSSPVFQKALLRVELAESLFSNGLGNCKEINVLDNVKEITRSWQMSEIEEVRMAGSRIGKDVDERYKALSAKSAHV